MAQTLNDIVLQIGRNFGAVLSGAATAATTTVITDTNYLIQPDNHWLNHYCRFAAADQERLITAHGQSTKTITVDPAFSNSNITTGSEYTILPLQWVDIVAAVQQAINSAGASWAVLKDDQTSLSFTPAQEYALPSDLVSINGVYGGDGIYWSSITSWEIIGVPGAYKLLFKALPELRIPQLPAETPLIQMRIEYIAMPTLMSASDDTTGVGDVAERELVQYLIEYASYILHRQAMRRNLTGEAARGHMSAAEEHRRAADNLKQNRKVLPVIRRVKTPRRVNVLG